MSLDCPVRDGRGVRKRNGKINSFRQLVLARRHRELRGNATCTNMTLRYCKLIIVSRPRARTRSKSKHLVDNHPSIEEICQRFGERVSVYYYKKVERLTFRFQNRCEIRRWPFCKDLNLDCSTLGFHGINAVMITFAGLKIKTQE